MRRSASASISTMSPRSGTRAAGVHPDPVRAARSQSRPAPTASRRICARTAAISATTISSGSRRDDSRRSISKWRRPGDGGDRAATRPHACCLVPERREELTTEGGLDVAGQIGSLAPLVRRLSAAGIRVSLFIDPDPQQIEASREVGAAAGRAAHRHLLRGGSRQATAQRFERELNRLIAGAEAGAAARARGPCRPRPQL